MLLVLLSMPSTLKCVGLRVLWLAEDHYNWSEFRGCVEKHTMNIESTALTCLNTTLVSALMNTTVALAILYLVITYLLLLYKLRSYRKQAYTTVQVGLVYNTLQVGCVAETA